MWFSDVEFGQPYNTAYLTHYSPSQSGLTRVNLNTPVLQNSYVNGIAPGLHGEEWFGQEEQHQLSHITPTGKLSNRTLSSGFEPTGVAVDKQGNVWFTNNNGCSVGRRSPTGKLTTYTVGGQCPEITVGPDGNIWVALYTVDEVEELSATTGAVLARYPMRLPIGIATLGQDVYVTEIEPGIVAQIAPTGAVTEYVLPAGRKLEWMVAGPDNAVWFDENVGPNGESAVGRLTPSGELSEVPVPVGGSVDHITATSNAIYFTQGGPTGNDGGVMRIPLSNFNPPTNVYVALGDSYSSGEGNPPYEPASDEQGWDECHRSEMAYAPLLDRELGLGPMRFVACSGATTNDLFHSNSPNNEPEQFLSLAKETKTVTLTIGGNDVGFPEVLDHCIEGFRPGGNDPWPYWQGPECSTNQQLRDLLTNRLKVLEGILPPSDLSGTPIHPISEVIDEIHADAPAARIVIGGYPKLFGSGASHFPLLHPTSSNLLERACVVGKLGPIPAPFSILYSDAQWINNEGDKLDSAIQAAAVAARKVGVSVRYAPPAKFKHHGLCDSSAPWIRPLEINLSRSQGYEPGSFHPTVNGQELGYKAAFAKVMLGWH